MSRCSVILLSEVIQYCHTLASALDDDQKSEAETTASVRSRKQIKIKTQEVGRFLFWTRQNSGHIFTIFNVLPCESDTETDVYICAYDKNKKPNENL